MADAHAPHAHPAHPHDDHGHGGGDHHEHIHDRAHYFKVYGALLGLFAISVLGPVVGIWWLTLITAFGIAVIKASMVVKYFMHLDLEPRFVHYFLVVSLLFMFLFFFAVAPDVMNHHGENWVNVAAQAAVDRGMAEGEGAGAEGGAHH